MTLVVDTLEARRLLRGTFLTASSKGVAVPAPFGTWPIHLRYPGLLLLVALAEGEGRRLHDLVRELHERTGCDRDELQALVDHLRDIDALTTGPAPGPLVLDEPRHPRAPLTLGPGSTLVLLSPLSFLVTPQGFAQVDPDGEVIAVLSPEEMDLAACFTKVSTVAAGLAAHSALTGAAALTHTDLEVLAGTLVGLGLMRELDPDQDDHSHAEDRSRRLTRRKVGQEMREQHHCGIALERHERHAAEVDARLGTDRVRITPIHRSFGIPPLGLGMVMAYAKEWQDGVLEQSYDFRPDWLAHDRDPYEFADLPPGIFLVSNYIWSHQANTALCEKLKRATPHSVMILGGPDTPKYRGDVEKYFHNNPHVDVAVHVEGEVSAAEILAALRGRIGEGPPDLSPLRDVPGISFRDGDEIVSTGERSRLTDLNVVPSPYLTGLFEGYGAAPVLSVTIETNRGCPYGCTFCDWGSSTMSRIRKFDLDRVFAELEWCARHGINGVGFADANFGILERDVEIAQRVAELKKEFGFPKAAGTNFAKNTTKHIKRVVKTWVDADIITQGVLSLQTMDAGTLETLHRSNIKTAKYDELAQDFRASRLPLFIDLMMGLPGQTLDSFYSDLQDTLEREVVAKIHPTALLVNSPMNEPGYKAENRIESAKPLNPGLQVGPEQYVVSTSTFTRDDYDEMVAFRHTYLQFENFGILRHVSRYVRHETGQKEIDLYRWLHREGIANSERYPSLRAVIRTGPASMAPPVSWALLMDDIHAVVVSEFGVSDDGALATVLEVQRALLPAPNRSFPSSYELAHDYPSWYASMIRAKEEVADQWTAQVAPLRSLPPARLVVDDPHHISNQGVGYGIEQGWLDSWELDSPMARPTLAVELD